MKNLEGENLKDMCNFLKFNGIRYSMSSNNLIIHPFLWVKIKVLRKGEKYELVTDEWRNGLLFILMTAWALMVRDDMPIHVLFLSAALLNLVILLMKIKITVVFSNFKLSQ
ncbi:hypothetical protein [Shewanella waksmanii]|uniref:hypothetical protein n=1 Tax=Shewanella waksmanii TaxID=213783 RepID=UPI0037354667